MNFVYAKPLSYNSFPKGDLDAINKLEIENPELYNQKYNLWEFQGNSSYKATKLPHMYKCSPILKEKPSCKELEKFNNSDLESYFPEAEETFKSSEDDILEDPMKYEYEYLEDGTIAMKKPIIEKTKTEMPNNEILTEEKVKPLTIKNKRLPIKPNILKEKVTISTTQPKDQNRKNKEITSKDQNMKNKQIASKEQSRKTNDKTNAQIASKDQSRKNNDKTDTQITSKETPTIIENKTLKKKTNSSGKVIMLKKRTASNF